MTSPHIHSFTGPHKINRFIAKTLQIDNPWDKTYARVCSKPSLVVSLYWICYQYPFAWQDVWLPPVSTENAIANWTASLDVRNATIRESPIAFTTYPSYLNANALPLEKCTNKFSIQRVSPSLIPMLVESTMSVKTRVRPRSWAPAQSSKVRGS